MAQMCTHMKYFLIEVDIFWTVLTDTKDFITRSDVLSLHIYFPKEMFNTEFKNQKRTGTLLPFRITFTPLVEAATSKARRVNKAVISLSKVVMPNLGKSGEKVIQVKSSALDSVKTGSDAFIMLLVHV